MVPTYMTLMIEIPLLGLALSSMPEPSLALEPPGSSEKPLACDVQALTAEERRRHEALGEKLLAAAVHASELPDGFELTLDLDRIRDSKGKPYCVVEVAEWVDLESRCCPFLDFGIAQKGKEHLVRLRLTGGLGVKEFLRTELPLLEKLERKNASPPKE